VTGPVPAAEFGRAYDAGLSVRGCMTRFGYTRVMVESALREAGTVMRPPGRAHAAPMSAEYAAQIRAVYDSGLRMRQTAEKIGCGLRAVTKGVTAGGAMRPPVRCRAADAGAGERSQPARVTRGAPALRCSGKGSLT